MTVSMLAAYNHASHDAVRRPAEYPENNTGGVA
jgi:hypothetical protein